MYLNDQADDAYDVQAHDHVQDIARHQSAQSSRPNMQYSPKDKMSCRRTGGCQPGRSAQPRSSRCLLCKPPGPSQSLRRYPRLRYSPARCTPGSCGPSRRSAAQQLRKPFRSYVGSEGLLRGAKSGGGGRGGKRGVLSSSCRSRRSVCPTEPSCGCEFTYNLHTIPGCSYPAFAKHVR